MLKKIIVGVLVGFSLLSITVLIIAGVNVQHLLTPAPSIRANKNPDVTLKPVASEKINILVIGIDQRPGDEGRSDTIMVYQLDQKSKEVKLLSIPRDTYVYIPGRGMDKINHAYAYGGADLSKRTIEEFLGIKIDYYIKTNFAGFTNLIDRIGGITVDGEKLDGARALAYVRNRQYPMGDISRVTRQQKFMKAVAVEVAGFEPKYKLMLSMPSIYQSVKTDLTLEETRYLYTIGQEINLDNVRMEQVPGWFYNLNGISYWKPDKIRTDSMVREMFN